MINQPQPRGLTTAQFVPAFATIEAAEDAAGAFLSHELRQHLAEGIARALLAKDQQITALQAERNNIGATMEERNEVIRLEQERAARAEQVLRQFVAIQHVPAANANCQMHCIYCHEHQRDGHADDCPHAIALALLAPEAANG